MIRLLGALGVLLALLVGAHDAQAQVLLPPCDVPQIAAPDETFKNEPRGWVLRSSEVIVEGVIESYSAAKADPYLPRLVTVRVDKTWKGDVTPRVLLIIPMARYGPDMWDGKTGLECLNPVQIGVRIRIGAGIAGKNDDPALHEPKVDANSDVLNPRRWWNFTNIPLHDPEFERLLVEYQAKTEALQQAAATGDVQAKLNFAAHLLANNQQDRAQEIADALRRDGVKLASFGTLKLTGERKDWSDLKRIHQACYSDHANLEGAVFDGADFAECAFRYSTFRGASFRGTDLTGSYFQDSDLTGAKYDCTTKLPEDLDPEAAGMINVEGTCNAK